MYTYLESTSTSMSLTIPLYDKNFSISKSLILLHGFPIPKYYMRKIYIFNDMYRAKSRFILSRLLDPQLKNIKTVPPTLIF